MQYGSRAANRPLIESLERRALFSVLPVATPAVETTQHAVYAAAKAPATTTTVSVSPQSQRLGQPIKVTATVKSTVKGTPVAGSVTFTQNGTAVTDPDGNAISVAVNAKGVASYTFGVGNEAFWIGTRKIVAKFVSTNTLPGSTSKPKSVKITFLRFATAKDGLETARVVAGKGKKLAKGQTATVQYTGLLIDTGVVFDYSSRQTSGTLQFVVQKSPEAVIQGFDEGVVGMQIGETRVIAFPSSLGYGSTAQTNIPANSSLVFFVKLVGISATAPAS